MACSHHTCHDSVLVSAVAAQINPADIFVFLVQTTNDFPSTIVAAVIDKNHHTVGRNQTVGNHTVEQPSEAFHRELQHLFFIIAGGYCR